MSTCSPPICCFCGSEDRTEWHHLQYLPIAVSVPLCKPCHTKIHKNRKAPKSPGKQVQIILDDKEYDELLKVKGERTWKELLVAKGESQG